MGKPQRRRPGDASYSESGLSNSLSLPEIVSPELGRLGPGFGYGVGCGVGLGLGLVGGLGIGTGFPGFQIGLGIGAGCGAGIGFGYGFGRGKAFDDYGDHSNVSRLPAVFRKRGGMPAWKKDFQKSALGRTGLGRMFSDLLSEVQDAVTSVIDSD